MTNQTRTDIAGWIQKFEPTLKQETEYLFKANSVTDLNISTQSPTEIYSLFYFEGQSSLKAKMICNHQIYPASNLEGGRLIFRKSDLDETKIWFQNLFTGENVVNIELLDSRMGVLSVFSIKLNSMEQLSYKFTGLDPSINWAYFRIEASQRMTAFNLTTAGSEGPTYIQPQLASPSTSSKYFVVGTKDHRGDEFIIQVTDPTMIQKARDQILDPSLEKIVFARVQKGHGGFNRNGLKAEKSFWSWSTTEVTNIADLGSTACNGIPQAVEDRADFWLENPGRICFWSYRIQKELTPEQVATGIWK